jgi:hypothetical protein
MDLSGTDWGIVLGALGLIVTIYFGVKALKAGSSQRQNVRSGSNAIQSGRDTKVGK